MKTNTKEFLRWLTIAVFGGFGVWMVVTSSYYLLTQSSGSWLHVIFGFGFLALVTSPFFIVAHICFRRRYRELFSVLGVVGAILVFAALISLPIHWHVLDFFVRHATDLPWGAFGLPVSLLCLFAPFYAAAWVLRTCRRLAQDPTETNKTRPASA